jgi:hypothetical protein
VNRSARYNGPYQSSSTKVFTCCSSNVKKGVASAKNNSPEDPLALFNDETGEFVQGERYLFAYDFNETTLALPYQKDIIGMARKDLKDFNGMAFLDAIRDLARNGGGYLYYVYQNPAQNNTEQVKITYVEPVDDSWFVGAGIYIPHIKVVMDKQTISELVSRFENAAVFAGREGYENASAAFNDRNGTWAEKNTYFLAMTSTGIPWPWHTGLRVSGQTGGIIQIHTAVQLPGLKLISQKWVEDLSMSCIIILKGGKDELKLCYVLPVQNDWPVGSGIYTGEGLS